MLIETKKLICKFNDKIAVNDVTLSIDGGFVCITGRSGSGKSTLLKMLGLILPPTSGKIFLGGQDFVSCSEKEKNAYRNTGQGFVFQDFYLQKNYTVAENVALPLLIARLDKKERSQRVSECLEFVGLSSIAKQKASTLSGGEQQRVAIARAIANRPKVILADEPCGNLDTYNSQNIINMFKALVRDGVTVVMVSHNQDDACQTDRIISMQDGEIVGDERA